MNRSRSHQKPLFDSRELRGPRVEKTRRPLPPPDEDSSQQQMFLFEDRVIMIDELEQALRGADYRKALEVKDKLEQIYGAGAVPPGLSYLERLGPISGSAPSSPARGWPAGERSHESSMVAANASGRRVTLSFGGSSCSRALTSLSDVIQNASCRLPTLSMSSKN